jgi:histone H3/H4
MIRREVNKMAKEMLVVRSKVKSAVSGLNVSSDVAEKLNELNHEILKKAAGRAQANGRRTLQGRDL